MPSNKIIIVHNYEQAAAAIEAASELQVPVTLQSPTSGIFYAGSLYLLQMFNRAKEAFPKVDATFIIDCCDAGAEAIGAIEVGHRHLRSSAPKEVRLKLMDIAQKNGVKIHHGAYEALDLQRRQDAKAACREWLSKD